MLGGRPVLARSAASFSLAVLVCYYDLLGIGWRYRWRAGLWTRRGRREVCVR